MYRWTVEPVLPFVVKHFSANEITAAGMAAGGGALWAAGTGNYGWAAAGTAVKTWLDWLDGPAARCSSSVTSLGDALDHVSDLLFYGGMGILLFSRIATGHLLYLLLLGLLVVGLATSIGCTEKYHGLPGESATLEWLQGLCPNTGTMKLLQRLNVNDLTLSLYYIAVLLLWAKKEV